MKKYLKFIIFPIISFFAVAFLAHSAPSYNIFRTILPEANNTYDLGSNLKRWANVYATNLDTSTISISAASTGDITIKKADPTLIYDVTTAGDTDFWAGVQDNADGINNDLYQIGKGIISGTTPYLTLDYSGNVGIGTTSPNSKFTVSQTPSDTVSWANAAALIGYPAYNSGLVIQQLSSSPYGMALQNEGAEGTTYPIILQPNDGNVGIGTTNPGSLLNVNGGNGAFITLTGSATNPATFYASNTGGAFDAGVESSTGGTRFTGSTAYAGVLGTVGATPLQFGTSDTIRATIDSSGNVGIGTTSPGQKLEINGGMRLNTATAKPTCDSTTRGTFWMVQGAAGVKDTVEVCAKDAADAYAWRTIY